MPKILLVDDAEDIRLSIGEMLKRKGKYEVVLAEDGFNALDVFRKEKPDLIISDINMPKCDGYELARRIKEIPNAEFIPIIFLSAKTSLQHQKEGFQCGVDNYICKPLERAQHGTFLAMIESLLVLSKARKEALSKIARDELTGLPKRKAFFTEVEGQIEKSKDSASKSCIAILDIDHFKKVNDNNGHLVGDHVLARFAEIVSETLRMADYLFRYGGEEFAILFADSNIKEAHLALERARVAVESAQFENNLPITFSSGMLELPTSADCSKVESYVAQADSALYEAKNTGRNKIIITTWDAKYHHEAI